MTVLSEFIANVLSVLEASLSSHTIEVEIREKFVKFRVSIMRDGNLLSCTRVVDQNEIQFVQDRKAFADNVSGTIVMAFANHPEVVT